MTRVAALAFVAALAVVTAQAQSNWAHVGQDPGHTKYSTLDQINTSNVAKLQRGGGFLRSPMSDAVIAFRLP